jgi:hypothetical protein
MDSLITETRIKTFVNKNITDAECDAICDVLDSIDFESIVKQKLAENNLGHVRVEVEN